MPICNRLNAFVPNAPITEAIPLCPLYYFIRVLSASALFYAYIAEFVLQIVMYEDEVGRLEGGISLQEGSHWLP
jgi:hypothetical protein